MATPLRFEHSFHVTSDSFWELSDIELGLGDAYSIVVYCISEFLDPGSRIECFISNVAYSCDNAEARIGQLIVCCKLEHYVIRELALHDWLPIVI